MWLAPSFPYKFVSMIYRNGGSEAPVSELFGRYNDTNDIVFPLFLYNGVYQGMYTNSLTIIKTISFNPNAVIFGFQNVKFDGAEIVQDHLVNTPYGENGQKVGSFYCTTSAGGSFLNIELAYLLFKNTIPPDVVTGIIVCQMIKSGTIPKDRKGEIYMNFQISDKVVVEQPTNYVIPDDVVEDEGEAGAKPNPSDPNASGNDNGEPDGAKSDGGVKDGESAGAPAVVIDDDKPPL
jgi:hypothetical protein